VSEDPEFQVDFCGQCGRELHGADRLISQTGLIRCWDCVCAVREFLGFPLSEKTT
jgi:hypothetical protein